MSSGSSEACCELLYSVYLYLTLPYLGLLGSRVISVLVSGAEGLGSNRSRDAVG